MPMEIPGPVISGPSETSSGYANIVVKEFGGGNRCSVVSITFYASSSTVGSTQQSIVFPVSQQSLVTSGVPIPMPSSGYYSVYAVGKCSSGEETRISNQLSVFSYIQGAPACVTQGGACQGTGQGNCCAGFCGPQPGRKYRRNLKVSTTCSPPSK